MYDNLLWQCTGPFLVILLAVMPWNCLLLWQERAIIAWSIPVYTAYVDLHLHRLYWPGYWLCLTSGLSHKGRLGSKVCLWDKTVLTSSVPGLIHCCWCIDQHKMLCNEEQELGVWAQQWKFCFQGVAQNRNGTTLLILVVSLPTAVPWAAEGTGP